MTLIYILLALVLAALALSYGLYRFIFHSPTREQNVLRNLPKGEQFEARHQRMLAMIDRLDALSYEPVSVMSGDGLRLNGKYYHVKDGAPLALCFHGYRGMGIRDFSGGCMLCMELGQNVLLVEQRAQESSGGHTISFGVNERFDVLRWIDYARSRFGADTEILLYGISMGAATVLMASALGLPENVKGIVADCPYSSVKEIICKVAAEIELPPAVFWPFIRLGALLFGGFRPEDGNALEAVKKAEVPILLIHGEDDRYVPCDMSRRIYEARPELISLHTFPGAGHGISFIEDEERYRRIVTEFIDGLDL